MTREAPVFQEEYQSLLFGIIIKNSDIYFIYVEQNGIIKNNFKESFSEFESI